MAAGVQQASNGATLTFEDHSHADAGGDSGYELPDLEAAVVSKGFKAADGVTPTIQKLVGATTEYLCHNNLQSGDGSGTAATLFRIRNGEKLTFVTGKGFDVSITGEANRTLEFGNRVAVAGEDPFGWGGGEIVLGKTCTWRGVIKLWGHRVRNTGGNLTMLPPVGVLGSEILDSVIEATGFMVLGQQSTNRMIERATGNKFVSRRTGLGGFNNWGMTFTDRNDFLGATALSEIFNTGSTFDLRNPVFKGPLATASVRLTGANRFVNPVWAKSVPLATVLVSLEEHWSFGLLALDRVTLAPVPGIACEIQDKDLATVLDVDLDASGLLPDFNTVDPTFLNALFVRSINTSAGLAEFRRDPFTVKLNHKRAIHAGYAPKTQQLKFPGKPWGAGGANQQLAPVFLVVLLDPPDATQDEMQFGAAEIPAMLAAVGQDVTFGGFTVKGLVKRTTVPLDLEGEGTLVGMEERVTVETGSLPGLAVGLNLSVDGTTYRAADVRVVGHGHLTEILLARV